MDEETTVPVPGPESGKTRAENAERTARFRALVRQAPAEPGVYIMKDSGGEIIYVGKARVLRNRLSSYFSGRKDVKTRHLVAHISTIEWILSGSEYEALLLENNLIKSHAPRYNINLKDGKTYPCIRITNEEFPRIFRTRRIVHDGSRYFGPFPGADIIDTYLDLIKRIFPLRRCSLMRPRATPCMYYHIGRCPGPCAGRITKEDYLARVDEIAKLLSGETAVLLADLRARMAKAAAELKFEQAGHLRDSILAIEQFEGRSSAVDFDPAARDYIAWASDGDLISFVVFQMRGGKLSGRDLFHSIHCSPEDEALQDFLMGYYSAQRLPPPEVFVQKNPGLELVAEYCARELGAGVAFLLPRDQRQAAAINLAAQNAREEVAKRRRESGDIPALRELKTALGLASLPRRIEGFDIAQLGGANTVASLISFKNGVPDKKNYRHFRIRSLKGAIDDFGAMREAVGRRYTRLVNEEAELPDLVLVDGGAGQVSAAKEILDALGVDCDLAGLAKRDEEIYLPGRADPVVLPRDSPALRVLVAVRDETHRFATGLSRKLRGDSLRFGLLETIEGVGPERAKKLMKTFGSAEALAAADIAAIAKAGGTGAALAAKIKAALSPASPAASPPSTLTRSSTLKRSSTSSTSSTSPTSS
jgi:excinuclease ABC subunit C